MWVCSCPSDCLLFSVEKPIDHDGVALCRISPTRARSFATNHTRSTVYGYTCRIGKDNFAAIGNSLWIDSAMAVLQSATVPRCVLAGTFVMPVNRDACECWMLGSERLVRENQNEPDCKN